MCGVGCGWLAARTRGREEVVLRRGVCRCRDIVWRLPSTVCRGCCAAPIVYAACFLLTACGSATWRSHPPIPHRGAGADCLPSTFSLPGYKRNPPGDTPDETPDDNPRRCTHLRTGRAPGHGWAGRAGGAAGLAAAAGRRGRVPAAARQLPYSHTGAGRCGEPSARVWRCVRTCVWLWLCVAVAVCGAVCGRDTVRVAVYVHACKRSTALPCCSWRAGRSTCFCCLFRL